MVGFVREAEVLAEARARRDAATEEAMVAPRARGGQRGMGGGGEGDKRGREERQRAGRGFWGWGARTRRSRSRQGSARGGRGTSRYFPLVFVWAGPRTGCSTWAGPCILLLAFLVQGQPVSQMALKRKKTKFPKWLLVFATSDTNHITSGKKWRRRKHLHIPGNHKTVDPR